MVRQIDRIFSSTKGLAQHYLWAIEYVEGLRPQFLDLKRNNEKLLADLQQAQRRIDDLEKVNANARKMLEEEMVKRKRTREHAEQLEIQLKNVKKALCDEAVDLNKATWAGFSFLQSEDECEPDRLDTIDEIETTGSIMTDLSYTREEDELLNDSPPESRRQKRPLAGEADNQEFGVKRRKSTTFRSLEVKSTDRVVATTTVTVERNNGPCTATATIETHKTATTPAVSRRTANITPLRNVGRPASDSDFEVTFKENKGLFGKKPGSSTSLQSHCSPFSMNNINTRPHNFVQKAILKGDPCNVCFKKVGFSKVAFKCKDCKALAHPQCKDSVPLPCIPISGTPTKHNNKEFGTIADYTPHTSPMVPSLVIHCIKEIEARGLKDLGLYRIPGSDKEVKLLKEKFLRGRGVPNLSEVADIHAVCGTLKEFLRSLKEPIVTAFRWSEFVRAAEIVDPEEREARLVDIIRDLPQPNRDTLSYVVLHLQRVAASPDCMMGFNNLATVFGQTIVGLKKDLTDPFNEVKQANAVMLELLKLPSFYYESLISCPPRDENQQPLDDEPAIPKTPSASSIFGILASPLTVKKKRRNYFETP
ncbi:Rac GTPase-activating protein [Nesidiocoris tenuis]|uniref:Rac GTPase-activating protein n=1 Tax=Nesidiocoris tenuis TaxID=355587 RepID=A0ABN7B5C2_9HEMI|nr:Rac GTPase-activating protein [Nesidiocoris tenuis]